MYTKSSHADALPEPEGNLPSPPFSRLTLEAAEYILKNGGPDKKGRAHPKRARLHADELEEAIGLASQLGLKGEWRPYHFRGTLDTYNQQKYVDEVLRKKCEQVLSQTFEGDLRRLLSEVTLEHLRSPLIDNIGSFPLTVSTSAVCQELDDSPYEIIKRYLEVIGQKTLARELRPYHLKHASRGTFEDSKITEDLLIRKGSQVLRDQFGGDLHRFLTEVDSHHLLSPLVDRLGGFSIEVSMLRPALKFGNSLYEMAKRFLELTGQAELAQTYRPYHMRTSSMATFNDPKIVDEVLTKKCNQLIKEKFGCDLHKFLTEVTQDHLLSPLIDTLGSFSVEVSMGSVCGKFKSSPYRMAKRYLKISGHAELAEEYRPYHTHKASRGIYRDLRIADEVLKKKCDQILQKQFDGDLHKFLTEVTLDHLLSPLIDTLGKSSVEVSTAGACGRFRTSPYPIAKRYLELAGHDDLAKVLRPYHMAKAQSGIFNDRRIVNEVLEKKCDQLIKDQFGGDRHRFLAEVRWAELVSPFLDNLCGHSFEVSMGQIGNNSKNSSYQIIKKYYSIKGWDFPYSPLCFSGPPETRERRLNGEFSAYDRKLMQGENGRFDTEKFGFRAFSAKDKSIVRNLMVEAAFDAFLDRDIYYLGLESETLESLRLIYQYLNLSPKNSTVVEMDSRVFNAMRSTVKAFPNGEAKVLSKVNYVRGKLDEVVTRLEGPYNLLNLDFLGHWSRSKAKTIESLISQNKLDNQAILVITLRDTALDRTRAIRAGFSSDQEESVKEAIRKASFSKYKVTPLFAVPYSGGTNGRESTSMVSLAFRLDNLIKT